MFTFQPLFYVDNFKTKYWKSDFFLFSFDFQEKVLIFAFQKIKPFIFINNHQKLHARKFEPFRLKVLPDPYQKRKKCGAKNKSNK